MRYRFIASCAFLIIVYSSVAQKKITTAGHWPRYRAAIHSIDNKIITGLLVQIEDSAVILIDENWKELRKREARDSMRIMYSQIQRIKLKKKNVFLNSLAIGGGIGLAPIVFGEGGAYVAVLTLPLGIITGTIVGITSSRKYKINEDYAAFINMKRNFR